MCSYSWSQESSVWKFPNTATHGLRRWVCLKWRMYISTVHFLSLLLKKKERKERKKVQNMTHYPTMKSGTSRYSDGDTNSVKLRGSDVSFAHLMQAFSGSKYKQELLSLCQQTVWYHETEKGNFRGLKRFIWKVGFQGAGVADELLFDLSSAYPSSPLALLVHDWSSSYD